MNVNPEPMKKNIVFDPRSFLKLLLFGVLFSGLTIPQNLHAQMNISVKGNGVDISNAGSSGNKLIYPLPTRTEWEERYYTPGEYHLFDERPAIIEGKDYATTPIATDYFDNDDTRRDYALNSFSADKAGAVTIAVPVDELKAEGWSSLPGTFSSTISDYYFYSYDYTEVGTWVDIPSTGTSAPTLLFADKGHLTFDNPLPLSDLANGVLITNNAGTYNNGPYIVDPYMIIMPNGDYLAGAHQELSYANQFGPDSDAARHWISKDKGKTWSQLTKSKLGLLHASTFYHDGALYALGDIEDGYGGIVKSTDSAKTWSEPVQLLANFRNSPSHVIKTKGRIWIAYENLPRPHTVNFLSASVDSDLMDADSWVPTVRQDDTGTGNEADMVLGRDDWPIAIPKSGGPKVRALSATEAISVEGKDDFELTGSGIGKYSAIYDPVSDKWWALTSYSPMEGNIRTGIALSSSTDLKTFTIEKQLIQGKSSGFHGFNYPFMQIDGDDIVFVVRTAWENEMGQAQRWHDANMLTFHRIPDFREL
jgi:hypothetical protein